MGGKGINADILTDNLSVRTDSYAADASAATGVSERTVRRKLYVQVDKTSDVVQQPRDEESLDAAALPTGAVNYRPVPSQDSYLRGKRYNAEKRSMAGRSEDREIKMIPRRTAICGASDITQRRSRKVRHQEISTRQSKGIKMISLRKPPTVSLPNTRSAPRQLSGPGPGQQRLPAKTLSLPAGHHEAPNRLHIKHCSPKDVAKNLSVSIPTLYRWILASAPV